MAQILVLANEIPLPIQATGTSLRLNPVLRHLAREHAIDLVAISDSRPDLSRRVAEAREFCRTVTALPRRRLPGMRRLSRTLRGMGNPQRPPWEFIDPFSKELVEVLVPILRDTRHDVLLAVNEVLDVACQLRIRNVLPPRFVVDWIDAPSLVQERRSEMMTPLRAHFVRRRTARLVEWQKQINAMADAAIYIAEADRAHAGAGDDPRVHVIPNGVLPRDRPLPRPTDHPPTIGFLGNMAYGPNVHAALRLHAGVFLPLVKAYPDLRLKIIGRDPDPAVRALASDRVEVTGEVESIWPHLAAVDVVVFPMTFGGGLQNKVLESAEAGCAVVVTRVGAAGLGAEGRDALIIEDSDEGMVQSVSRLLDDPDELAEARARASAIRTMFDWAHILPRYAEVVLGPGYAPPAGG